MHLVNFFVTLGMIMCVAASNPTYWIRKHGDRKVTTSTTTTKPFHDPTPTELQAIVDCNFHRNWECALDSDLSPKEEFCKRLATDQPNESEKVYSGPDKFETFREIWVQITGTNVYVEPTNCYAPTQSEKQQVEDCFFSRSWRQKESTNLTALDTFCIKLATEKPIAANVSEMKRLLAYRKMWASMPDVGRLDYSQMMECSALEWYFAFYPDLLSGDCIRYFKLLKNPKTMRDIKRKQMHDCMDPSSLHGNRKYFCMCLVHTYRQLFYPDK